MKRLFFAALVATAAAGGALSANAIDIYPESGNDSYTCNEIAPPTCVDSLPASGRLYKNPQKTIEISRDDLSDYHFVGVN